MEALAPLLATGECQLKAEVGKKAQSIGGGLPFSFSFYLADFHSPARSSFPFTPPTWVVEATEAKGCPNWEVGIMGRINMQGLDTYGGRRWRRRSRRRTGGLGLQEGGEATKGVEGEVWMEKGGFPFSVSVSPTLR